MLELKDIRKQYGVGDSVVHALAGVSLKFRENEFVSILGASGCGKTTMLNIIGGLDRYTSGDLVINGKSTKDFKDSDWDTYRNHSIGFVFQSYNLIPHQTVLANVELALTLSGVSKAERRQRATEALTKVGLGDQLNKKPNQMSGGQMQRVAIARALVNNPDILLADEPTGALDTTTSVQIMDLLKEVAREKLVIMVTHNPELAEEYSTRIVRLSDGQVVSDTAPYNGEDVVVTPIEEAPVEAVKPTKKKEKAKKADRKKSMSFGTALSLSFNNLLTKKARTFLTSFAGSIGIIGIALILSLSNGIQAYIDQVQEDTLSTYPLTLNKTTQDYASMMQAMNSVSNDGDREFDENKIYVDDSLGTMMSAMSATVENDLAKFKLYLEENGHEIEDCVSDIQYTYDFDLQVFTADGKTQVSPTEMFDKMGDSFEGISEMVNMVGGFGVMSEMIDNQELLNQQYELVGDGHWPTEANEVVLVISKNNQISKMTLYMLGILPQEELEDVMTQLMTNGTYESAHGTEYSIDDFLGMEFYMLNTSDFFVENEGDEYLDGYNTWNDLRDDIGWEDSRADFVTKNGTKLVISGIVRPKADATSTSIMGAIGYTKALTEHILDLNSKSKIINQQKATPEYNVLTGLKFERTHYTPETIHLLVDKIDGATMESFYSYMTDMIKTNPEFSSQLNVTESNFAQMFMLMPEEQQVQLVSTMLEAAKANPANTATPYGGLNLLCATMKQMMGGTIEVTTDNITQLLPIMSMEQRYVLVNGAAASQMVPIDIPGLSSLAGNQVMSSIYSAMTEALYDMTVDENIFLALLGTMKEDSEEFKTLEEALYNLAPQTDATYDSTLKTLGDAESADPASINFYAKDFESKDKIEQFIAKYNEPRKDTLEEIKYSDVIGDMMDAVALIINVISYVLIAFVSISLIVSSIMIGIITYISVLERTKEIGILRSIGASKKDVSRVFTAETLIVGLTAGLIGIIATALLCIPINLIIHVLTNIGSINAVLPWVGAIALVLISMLLTFIAGLFPSRIAAKKDPVEALRTE
ncbi:MAG: ABC transporter ATP-binding protein/permease [Ruminococcaceae bacterium]|nr:ABC transporter ATP-binding protein/permease [Oscillospiraceae bacterium]